MKFIWLLAAAQLGGSPTEADMDYSAALDAWSKCGFDYAKTLPNALPNAEKIGSGLTKACASEREGFKARMINFIMIDGDPRGVAEPIADDETAKFHRHMIFSVVQGTETRFLLQDKPLATAWLDCLDKAAAKSDKDQFTSACAAEEKKLTEANLKRMKAAGLPDAQAPRAMKSFANRTRRTIANRTEGAGGRER